MTKIEAFQVLGLSGNINQQDIKLAYRRKAQQFHPDRNPAGTEIMKMINAAYELIKNEEQFTVAEDATITDYPEILAAALAIVMPLGLSVEVCGLWVWVSGDTKPHKDTLKEAGYLWAPKKIMWYYRPANAKSFRFRGKDKSEWSIDKIREVYGSARPTQTKSYYLEEAN
ncbi:MAG: DnaJ domain protein [Gammaproteobacteria bacterium]|jgi:hypothetical protein|nr:DnaJ domain protein [Gammaproteobacteria bacterium]